MAKTKDIPVAMTIAGSDSGGGAGVQADLKTFAALGVHGTSAITCVTAQNPGGVSAIQACRVEIVRAQMEAIFSGLKPGAAKTGMLLSREIIRVVVEFFLAHPEIPLVVDPVMVATSGRRLLRAAAVKVLREELLLLAALVTPNLGEAGVLTGKVPETVEEMRAAAREIHRRFRCAVLVKGGHLRGAKEAADIFFDGTNELLLTAPFVKGVRTHGTGCTYSAAITAYLARGNDLPEAVTRAKEHITGAIAGSRSAGGNTVLESFWRNK